MNIHTQLNVRIERPFGTNMVAITFVSPGKEDGTVHPISPTAYMNQENAKLLARVIDEHADLVPREMVEGDL